MTVSLHDIIMYADNITQRCSIWCSTHNWAWTSNCTHRFTGIKFPEQSTTVIKLNCMQDVPTQRSCQLLIGTQTFRSKCPAIEFINSCARWYQWIVSAPMSLYSIIVIMDITCTSFWPVNVKHNCSNSARHKIAVQDKSTVQWFVKLTTMVLLQYIHAFTWHACKHTIIICRSICIICRSICSIQSHGSDHSAT